jgi:hypothetical protein
VASGAKTSTFRAELEAALEIAVVELREKIGKKSLRAFVLYTSGDSDFVSVCASAVTVAGLEQYVAEAKARWPELEARDLAWIACDWDMHDFSAAVRNIELPPLGDEQRDEDVFRDFVGALQALDERGRFGSGKARPMLAVTCGDMDEDFLLGSLRQLNPPSVVAGYLEENSTKPYLAELARLPVAERIETVIGLYRELRLEQDTPRTREAQRRHVSKYELDDTIEALGHAATGRLLDLIEAHGLRELPVSSVGGRPFGAVTLDDDLATSCAILLATTGLAESDVGRIQGVLARRVELDRGFDRRPSPLAACLARTLHDVFPARFPEAIQKAVRLENPDPFLENR